MAVQHTSALWSSRFLVLDWIDIVRLIDDLTWDRLGLQVPHQEQTNWCWAATTDGIDHYYDPASTWTQCQIVDAQLGRGDCCGPAASGPCNQPGYVDQALTTVGHFDHWAGGPADFATVDTEIDGRRPIAVRIGWSGGGGHAIAVGGYREWDQQVHVEDPWYGPSDLGYTTLRDSYQSSGTWTDSYFTKA
jgi:hypothetical protein